MNLLTGLKDMARAILVRLLVYFPIQRLIIHGAISYSQEGEDRVLHRMFEYQTDGFFVDVGAHHPMRFSNTYGFYRLGWTGVNIEPRPGSMRLFHKFRPRDTSLEMGVADQDSTLMYYQFDEPALNSFDPAMVEAHLAKGHCQVVDTHTVAVKPLRAILDEHLPRDTRIDFLNVDVEGLDMTVLESNDWARYRPRVVLAESLGMGVQSVLDSPLYAFMREQGYELYAKTCHTCIYRDQNVL